MKKIFTLITMAVMALGAQAFTDTWKSASSSTSPVELDNIKVTFSGTWTFGNNYAAGSENGQSVVFEPTESGNLTIIFGGAISTSKKLHMQDADGNGLTATLVGDNSVTIADNANPAADIASGGGIIYAIEAGKTYTFSVSGTTWRFASLKFTNEVEVEYTTEWNFSEWEDATGLSNQVKNNLGLLASYKDAEKAITNFGAINASNKGSYTKRFQFGGGGAPLTGTGTPTQRFVYFNVNGDAGVAVQCISGSSSEERTLYISDGTNVIKEEKVGSSLKEIKAYYTGSAGVIYIYSSAAINLYDIKASNVGTTALLDDTTKPTATGIQTVKAAEATNGAVYNLAGQKVSESYKGVVIKNGKKMVNK
jgi:hypothetical protein